MAATRHAETVKSDTRACIATALLELLEKQPLPSLSVARVCQRAGVSRMAFYRNFQGLDQVLYERYKGLIAPVFAMVLRSFSFEEKRAVQARLFDLIGADMVASVERGFEPIIRRIFEEEIRAFFEPARDEYWLAFASAGVYALWRKWLLDGRTVPLQDIMAFLRQVDGLAGVGGGT